MQTLKRISARMDSLRLNRWLYPAILAGLILFPQIVGLLTGDSPLGIERRGRLMQAGESVFWQSVLIEVFILAILAMSYNLIFGFTGIISFGHALFFGMGGYLLGMLTEKSGLSMETGLILGVVLGIAVAALLGLLIGLVSLRLKGVYFAMFTLAIAEMFFIYFSRLPTTQAEDGFAITALPTWLDARQNRLSFYYIALVLFVLTFVFVRRLIHSPTGAVFLAIRENEERARAIGFDTLRFKLAAIMISGVIASVAGMLQVLLNKKVGPELLSLNFTVDPLLHTIIGGIGTFTGPIIGAASLHLGDTLLRDAEFTLAGRVINIGDSWALILGIIFIVVVLVFPQGVVGTWNRWRARRQAASAEAPSGPTTPAR